MNLKELAIQKTKELSHLFEDGKISLEQFVEVVYQMKQLVNKQSRDDVGIFLSNFDKIKEILSEVTEEENYFPLTIVPQKDITKEKIADVIRSKTDEQDWTLVVTRQGKIELEANHHKALSNTNNIFYNESFFAGNDYVGEDAANDEHFINQLYETIMEVVDFYLKTNAQEPIPSFRI